MDDRTTGVDRAASPAAAQDDTDERARELRSEIAQTREDLSETVDAIQEKLRPSNVAANAASATTEKVKDMAYSAAETAEEWWDYSGGSGLVERIRNNPIPAALAGVGLAWLAFGNGGSRRRYRQYEPPSYRDWLQREDAQSAFRGTPAYGGTIASEGTESYEAGKMQKAETTMHEAKMAMRHGRNRLQTMIDENPLAVGAAAAVLGAAVGLALPLTERENELMGEARETAVQRAQEAATGAIDRVKDAAADAVTKAAVGD
jgi:Protein of unknown function (DUF3618)